MIENNRAIRISFHFIEYIVTVFVALVVYQALFKTILTKQIHFFFYILY